MPDCRGTWLDNQGRCSDPECCKPVRHRVQGSFDVIRLSIRSADMLASLEEAATRFGAAVTAEEHLEAYRRLTAVREVVYKRQEQLEKKAGVEERPAMFRC